MSHMSRDSTRADSNTDVLQTSNQTSGYFLGTVPREWMRSGSDGCTIARTTNTNVVKKKSRSASVAQRRARRSDVGQSTEMHAPTEPASHDSTAIEPTQDLVATEHRSDQIAKHISDFNNSAVDSNSSHVARSDAVVDMLAATAPSLISPVTAAPLLNDSLSISPVNESVPPQHHAQYHSNASGIPILDGTTHNVVDGRSTQHNGRRGLSLSTSSDPHQSNHESWSSRNMPSVVTPILHQSTASSSVNIVSAPVQTNNVQQATSSVAFPQSRLRMTPRLDLLRELNQRLLMLSPHGKLGPADTSRIDWLRAACRHGDMLYMLLHQFACIHFIRPHLLPSSFALDHNHITGLGLLDQVFTNSRLISPDAMSMLANFVIPLEAVSTDASIQSWLPRMRMFLSAFATCWVTLQQRTIQRQYPPSAFELYSELGSYDYVLSQAIYTRLFSQLVMQADPVLTQNSIALFKRSQDILYQCVQEGRIGAVWQSTREHEIQQFAAKFREMSTVRTASEQGVYPAQNQAITYNASLHQTAPPSASTNPTPILFQRPVLRSPSMQASAQHTLMMPPRQIPQAQRNAQHLAQSYSPPRLFPGPGQILPMTANPNPARSALHQAHLASPILVQAQGKPSNGSKSRLYSFLHEIIGQPQTINFGTVFETWTISIDPEIMKRRVQVLPASKDDLFGQPTRVLHNGDFLIHLRCVEAPVMNEPFDQATHSASNTVWPEHLFVSINGNHLEFRRRVHHGRDLPVDVTWLLQDTNEMKLSYYATKKEEGKRFTIVLESIIIFEEAKVLELPRFMDVQTSLSAIVQSQQDHSQDDEVVMNGEHLSIDLIDPFTARISDKPARGKNCRHRECFDLEAFLQSRGCRNKDDHVHPDEWKCPICSRDARPTSLVIDQFLLHVKETLIANGKQDTKAILVKADGSWEPKPLGTVNHSNTSARASREPTTTGVELTLDDADDAKNAFNMAQSRSISAPSYEPIMIDLIEDDD